MKQIIVSFILLLSITGGLSAQTAPDAPALTRLLQEFLAGAGRNDAAVHERFWAEDLIYTSAKGRRKGKAEIMREVRDEGPSQASDETTVYSAEDVCIQQYGDTAIIAFRLVATTDKAGTKQIENYLNTGTFVKRDNVWQAVGWQATAMPKTEAKKP
ncbi:MAG TPA: nuclear transport factor 2 family protein [Chthoniobacterales bacterium]|nr:nuclear transport factor 2 family protein [Chthoniobacterales bacterium]